MHPGDAINDCQDCIPEGCEALTEGEPTLRHKLGALGVDTQKLNPANIITVLTLLAQLLGALRKKTPAVLLALLTLGSVAQAGPYDLEVASALALASWKAAPCPDCPACVCPTCPGGQCAVPRTLPVPQAAPWIARPPVPAYQPAYMPIAQPRAIVAPAWPSLPAAGYTISGRVVSSPACTSCSNGRCR